MKPRTIKLLLAALICFLAVSVVVTLKLREFKTQSAIQRSRVILFTYALASTNYFAKYNEWPRSLTDLHSNKDKIAFVSLNSPGQDGWGTQIEYDAFSELLGYGVVKSLGADGKYGGTGSKMDLSVRFSATNVYELP